jgi:hypothetical protein
MNALHSDLFRQGRQVSIEEFNRLFDQHWELMTKRFFKFEGLQFYDEGPDGMLKPFQEGKYEEFGNKLKAARAEDEPFFATAKERGCSFVRVHAARTPFTSYMQAEFYSYVLSEQLGERIYYLAEEVLKSQLGFVPPDYICFDSDCVLVHDYNENGTRKGGWAIEDHQVISSVEDLSRILESKAIPFRELMTPAPDVVAMLL